MQSWFFSSHERRAKHIVRHNHFNSGNIISQHKHFALQNTFILVILFRNTISIIFNHFYLYSLQLCFQLLLICIIDIIDVCIDRCFYRYFIIDVSLGWFSILSQIYNHNQLRVVEL